MTAIDNATRALIEAGSALLLGTVDAHGRPRASRAWGLQVVDAASGTVRIMLPGDDPQTVANLRATRRLAVTAANVATYDSVQGKGTLIDFAEVTAADRRAVERYCDAFFGDVERTDGIPRVLVDRIRAHGVLACTAIVDEWFDQTPGPRAGAALRGRA